MDGQFHLDVSRFEPWDDVSRLLMRERVLVSADDVEVNLEWKEAFDEGLLHGMGEAAVVYALGRIIYRVLSEKNASG